MPKLARWDWKRRRDVLVRLRMAQVTEPHLTLRPTSEICSHSANPSLWWPNINQPKAAWEINAYCPVLPGCCGGLLHIQHIM